MFKLVTRNLGPSASGDVSQPRHGNCSESACPSLKLTAGSNNGKSNKLLYTF